MAGSESVEPVPYGNSNQYVATEAFGNIMLQQDTFQVGFHLFHLFRSIKQLVMSRMTGPWLNFVVGRRTLPELSS